MAAEPSSEQRELTLVGKVEMRIALTDSDEKLESTLKTYLAPLLLKLASEHQSIRNKVISICQHINTRVKPQSVKLPVAALVEQFKAQESPLIRHFDLLYIQQGVNRISNAEKAKLLPLVVSGISSSDNHGSQMFNLLLRLLESFALPLRGSKEDADLRSQFKVSDEDAAYLSLWIGRLLLFTPQKGTNPTSAGLTAADYTFLTLQGKEDVWNPAAGGLNLLRTKILAAKLLASGLFNDSERFLPALFAAADPASSVSDVGDDMLKRALPATDLEDEILIRKFYDLYFGSDAIPRVRAPLRLKILGLLNKSTKSTTFADQVMRLVDDGINSGAMDGEDVVMSNGTSGSSRTGLEATKLRSAIFTYINFVARYGSQDTRYAIASRVIGRLRDFIENQGWPKPGPNEDMESRGYAYEVIGLLAKAGSRSILVEEEHPSLDLLRWLFAALAKDDAKSIVNVREALSTVLEAFSRLDLSASEQSVLEDFLVEEMIQSANKADSKRARSTRFNAIRFANRCLPFSSAKARWVDILGLGATNERAEVREEAEKGLNPYWWTLNRYLGEKKQIPEEIAFPTFQAMVDQCFPTFSKDEDPFVVVRRAQSSHPDCFQSATAFSQRILFQEAMQKADVAIPVSNDWERKQEVAVLKDVKVRKVINDHIRMSTESFGDKLRILQCALFEGISTAPSNTDQHLVEFLALAPDSLVQSLVPYSNALLPILRSNEQAKRTQAGRAFGILASHQTAVSNSTVSQLANLVSVSQKWETASGTESNHCQGAIVALAFYFSRAKYRGVDISVTDHCQASITIVLDILLKSRDSGLQGASYIFLGQLCMYGAISTQGIEKTVKIRTIVDKLYEGAKGGNEAAILCLGQLSMILPEDPDNSDSDMKYIEEQLHKLHEIRQSEAHFSVGEAFSYLVSGWQSSALATEVDIEGPEPTSSPRTSTAGSLTDRILKDCENTKPSLKKAAVMWLLCLVQFCGAQSEIVDRLPRCQLAFKRCLVDRDELVQETASRGLGLVYEKGDRKLKDELVRDLVSSFSSDRQSQLAGNVSADTQLFEPGALPTGDGSVSTYKDIMSLASEVGDSRLVYKFMAMASSNAIWSSRAAFGKFGLSSVLSDSSVDGYLANNPKLYPKLFRYRFDPNSGVQRSMRDIWNALVKDSATTIDQNFDAIMEDLLTNILGKEWRVREASCAAIADLVSWPLEKYEKYLERIWTQCFKVLDDIKQSVRIAAGSLARTLTGVLVKALEADHSSTKNAAAMLKHVLPFLLSPSGLESSAKDVQALSISTLLEIIKKSNGSTLLPFIPDLVERLIGLLSSVEPEAVNYIHLNASKYNLTEQKIDDMRLSSVRASPLMEAIERCLDLLDDTTMCALQPRLESALKNAVGLPSKVGSSRVLVSLSTRRMALFRPFSDDFLKLIERLVLDRNDTVASSYAVAAGYIARSASDKQILHLISFAKRLYFESEGDREGSTPRRSISSGEIMYNVAKCASDRFNALAASALPFAFVAKHDSHDQVKEQFQNTWNESVGGSRAVLLYLNEILELCMKHLDSLQWTLKHTSARAVADATIAVSSIETTMSEKVAGQLWPAIEKALGGKTWEGKETVLAAFVKFVEKGQAFYMQRQDVKAAITKIATREAKRQNAAYRQHSVKALGQVALARADIDMAETVFEIVSPLLTESADDGAMDLDDDDSRKSGEIAENTRIAAVETTFNSINPVVANTDALGKSLEKALKLVASLQSPPANIRKAIYESLTKVFGRIRKEGNGDSLDFNVQDLRAILFGPQEAVEAMRVARVDAISAIEKSASLVSSKINADHS